MANFNKVMLMGNVTRDIELRYTPKGTAVADIGLAVNRVRSGDGGERIEETTFVDVTLWGRTAEVAHQYSGKGKPLFVEGRLHMDSWDDKATGQKRSKLKVVADNIQLMGAPWWLVAADNKAQAVAIQPLSNKVVLPLKVEPQRMTTTTSHFRPS